MNAPNTSTVLVGVNVGVADAVLLKAAEFAELTGSQLVCGYVDISRTPLETLPDGSMRSSSMDPDLPDDGATFPGTLNDQLARVLDPLHIEWSTRLLAGDPAAALSALAERADAVMIVVGTRESAMKDHLREFVNGSVAVRLSHRQHRPVLVIPQHPLPGGIPLPWEIDDLR